MWNQIERFIQETDYLSEYFIEVFQKIASSKYIEELVLYILQ